MLFYYTKNIIKEDFSMSAVVAMNEETSSFVSLLCGFQISGNGPMGKGIDRI